MGYKAVMCMRLGDILKPESSLHLEVVEMTPGRCGPTDVRIAVSACGVNFADILMLQGKYQEKPTIPFVPGAEVKMTTTCCHIL
jgi:NADPH2:quinone reductase